MVNDSLVNLLDRVLGTGVKAARDNRMYPCPFCNHHKPKLGVNLTPNEKGLYPYNCWVCGVKGKSLSKVLLKAGATQAQLEELASITKTRNYQNTQTKVHTVELPKEFKALSQCSRGDITARHALAYLKARGVTSRDIFKYNIGYCATGAYRNMIIIPSYDEEGKLNYFVARNFDPTSQRKYKNPQASRDIIGLELFINWDLPVILCEGMFDAIAIRRNVVPLLGKQITNKLLLKLTLSKVEKIYIALDKDAQTQALKHCEQLLNMGKEVYLVDLEDKDPSDMGFENFTNLIQNTLPLDYYDLMQRKLQAI